MVLEVGDAVPAGPPPTVTLIPPEEWIHVEIRLADFPTATPEVIAGLAFVAEGPAGRFQLEVDEVEVRRALNHDDWPPRRVSRQQTPNHRSGPRHSPTPMRIHAG